MYNFRSFIFFKYVVLISYFLIKTFCFFFKKSIILVLLFLVDTFYFSFLKNIYIYNKQIIISQCLCYTHINI